jgi:hypothetical protein
MISKHFKALPFSACGFLTLTNFGQEIGMTTILSQNLSNFHFQVSVPCVVCLYMHVNIVKKKFLVFRNPQVVCLCIMFS